MASSVEHEQVLNSARRKSYRRLLPLLVLCYIIAYVDRANVGLAKLLMQKDMPAFNDAVIGFGAGVFFVGYFLLEIPGTLLCEAWSARKWISRIMVSWGIVAAATAWVKTPTQFYVVRFILGLAEAGFFPGAIIYMTHWFLNRDRTRALGIFMISTPIAQLASPKISSWLLSLGTTARPGPLGLVGWQWMYIAWGLPAVILGFVVLFFLTDHPNEAGWLTAEERQALGEELAKERAMRLAKHRMTAWEAVAHPKVLLLALAYFCVVTGNYGLEFFLPSILQQWYGLELSKLTWLLLLPPTMALTATLLVGWNSDRTGERRLHAALPALIGGVALALWPLTRGHLPLTMACLMITAAGLKCYLAPFWALPSLFLSKNAAASSVGLINSLANLGGFLGPSVLGFAQTQTHSYVGGIYFMAFCMGIYSMIIIALRLGRKDEDREGRGFEPIMAEPAESRQST
ncbi:MAG TPA: MFS transporter [Tepidisphaeraceae bacterium]|nr:MFS transporter [Tepidisphaeraceae bacterium]